MSTAREEILGRIRAATKDVPADEPTAWDLDVDRDPAAAYRRIHEVDGLPARFGERVAEYRARAQEVDSASAIAAVVGEVLRDHTARRIAVPPDVPPAWLPAGVEVLDGALATVKQLDEVDGVLTGCALAIAETGTFVLDGGRTQGPRRLTLLPDLHVCIVHEDQIVASVPEAITALGPAIRDGRPLTFVSGPSATSDIELERVEGVHGPRRLEVLIVR